MEKAESVGAVLLLSPVGDAGTAETFALIKLVRSNHENANFGLRWRIWLGLGLRIH
jgi:hypothetical protein